MGYLRLDSLEAMLKGGGRGPAIKPGDPDGSLLIRVVKQSGDLKMPLGAPKLSDDEINNLVDWVKEGAIWPKADAQATAAAAVATALGGASGPARRRNT